MNRTACLSVPDDSGLPLIGDADSGNLRRLNTGLCDDLHHHGVLGGPNLHSVVFHPPLPWIVLGKFLLCQTGDILILIKENCTGAGRALIQGQQILCQSESLLSVWA